MTSETPSKLLPRSPLVRVIAIASLALALGGVAAWRFAAERGIAAGENALIGGGFNLVDQFGKPRSDADFRGQFMLVFFGFTNCPDICPVELQTISDALQTLGPAADKVAPIFITVDPARDTSDALRDYVVNFHPRLVALTGSEQDVGTAAKAYRVYYAKASGAAAPSDPAAYIMDHSAIVYLMGPDGDYLTHFSPGTPAADMAKRLAEYL